MGPCGVSVSINIHYDGNNKLFGFGCVNLKCLIFNMLVGLV